MDMAKSSEAASKSDTGLLGFFSELFSGLLGGSGSDREKKRQLKDIRKELKKRGRFFRLKGDLAQPGQQPRLDANLITLCRKRYLNRLHHYQ